jgi:hypothetical protein
MHLTIKTVNFEFFIGVAKGKNSTLTQAEVNKILQSLRPALKNQS